ncbi:hypothetical protein HZS_369 [Henneguya salminicola]|nr:hypothetical protein HZS_369 [Henneguya salminicola]
MRTTQQNTRSVYNQINRQLIELMERCDPIPIITLLEQISYLLTFKNFLGFLLSKCKIKNICQC